MHDLRKEKHLLWGEYLPGPLQPISTQDDHPALSIARLDLIQSWASGNKYFKLKYILEQALAHDVSMIVSKGGMFSNHLAALSDACAVFGIKLVAVVRSHIPDEGNPTIRHLRKNGSEIIYISPDAYRSFDEGDAERLFPNALFIPEGGLSDLGIRGATDIVPELMVHHPTHIILAGGAMGTACGILSSAPASVKVIIVPAWKGCTDSYLNEIFQLYNIRPACTYEIWPDAHFGGFGKFNPTLIDFMSAFTARTSIPLDPVYTGKLMFAIDDKIRKNYFQKSDFIIAIHSGGLQGIDGYKYRFPEAWGKYGN